MVILDDIPCEIDADEVFETRHLDAQHRYAGEVRALIDKAREFARPRGVYEIAFVEERETDAVVLAAESQPQSPMCPGEEPGRARFVSAVLRANLDEVERVFPYVVTCGEELDSISIGGGDDVLGGPGSSIHRNTISRPASCVIESIAPKGARHSTRTCGS